MTTIGKYATALVVVVAGVCTLTDSALAKRNPKLDQVPVKVSAAPADSPSGPDMTSRGGESCDSPAQCDGDANGDGAVDPLDSGAILARFGLDPCVGGNLQYDVNCDGTIDPLDAGYVLARFGTCNPVTLCYPCDPPPNDNCENAIEAFLGDTSYCTGGATQDGPADCDEFTGRSDIWFFHEVTKDGNIEIGQCLTTDPNYDPTISIYDGSSCPVGAPLACSDDGCGTGGGPGVVTIFAAEVGDILLIRVGGWNDTTKGEEFNVFEQGEGILTIKDHGGPCCLGHDLPGCDFYEEGDAAEIEACVCAVDPFCCNNVWDGTCVLFVEQFCDGVCLVNDDCADNIPIEDGLNVYSTVLATTDGDPLPEECEEQFGLNLGNDIWYCYTASCTGTATFSTCNDDDPNSGEAEYDSRLAAYLGCDCPATNDNLVACNDDGTFICRDCMGFSSWLEVDVVEGTDYLIRVGAFESDAGTGVLAVSCGDVGGPDNDDCADGINLSDGVTAFSLVGATTDGPNPTDVPKCDEGFDLDLVNDIWYNYTASCTGTVTVSTCDDAEYDTRLAAYSGTDCPVSNDVLVGCNDDGEGCADFTSIMTFDAVVGQDYKIRVGGFGFDCSGNLTVSCD